MSCLALDELTLSEQASVMVSVERACARRLAALLATLAPRDAIHPVTPSAGTSPDRGAIPLLTLPGSAVRPSRMAPGRVSAFPHVEDLAMAMQRQVTDHPPLLVCHPGHLARMYETRGDCRVVFHVECCLCGVRTDQLVSQEAAADEWAHRRVHPIPQPQKDVA